MMMKLLLNSRQTLVIYNFIIFLMFFNPVITSRLSSGEAALMLAQRMTNNANFVALKTLIC